MDLTTMIVVVVLLVAIWWLMRKRRAAAEEESNPRPRAQKKTTQYHAVSIKFKSNACNAAKAMAGRRFLATAAPKLPLPDCDVLECNCRFAHHDDRRSGKDRRSPFAPGGGLTGTGAYEKEQREGKDRRKGVDIEL